MFPLATTIVVGDTGRGGRLVCPASTSTVPGTPRYHPTVSLTVLRAGPGSSLGSCCDLRFQTSAYVPQHVASYVLYVYGGMSHDHRTIMQSKIWSIIVVGCYRQKTRIGLRNGVRDISKSLICKVTVLIKRGTYMYVQFNEIFQYCIGLQTT